MPIVLSSAMVSANAAVGTIVGALSLMDAAGANRPGEFHPRQRFGRIFRRRRPEQYRDRMARASGLFGIFPGARPGELHHRGAR
jgi:hypothetical protein